MKYSFKLSVIIPVIYLTVYSRKAIRTIYHQSSLNPEVCFILSCSEQIKAELTSIWKEEGRTNNVIIVASSIAESNYLRYRGFRFAESEYVYYQDCDDAVNYPLVLDGLDYCNGDNVVCFNINRRAYDEKGNEISNVLLYPSKDFEVHSINTLMTNIVNKLIPKKILEKVKFYNIPFSQDLSLSFQLYELCPHFYHATCAYLYENNPKSTAGKKKTKRKSLLRVVAMERILLCLLNNPNNKAYVQYRYENIIQGRFAYLGECYWPKFSCRALNPFVFGLKGANHHLYHYIRSYLSSVQVYMKSINK